MQRGVFEEKPLFSNASSPLSLFFLSAFFSTQSSEKHNGSTNSTEWNSCLIMTSLKLGEICQHLQAPLQSCEPKLKLMCDRAVKGPIDSCVIVSVPNRDNIDDAQQWSYWAWTHLNIGLCQLIIPLSEGSLQIDLASLLMRLTNQCSPVGRQIWALRSNCWVFSNLSLCLIVCQETVTVYWKSSLFEELNKSKQDWVGWYIDFGQTKICGHTTSALRLAK